MLEKRQALQTQGIWGRRETECYKRIAYATADVRSRNYTVGSEGVCHRTDVAARIRTLRPRQWEKYVQGNLPENAQRDSKASAFIAEHMLQEYMKEARQALEILEERKCEIPSETLYVLERRWEQIKNLIAITLDTRSETSE